MRTRSEASATRAKGGVSGRIRTCDLPFRKRLLYPAELRRHGADAVWEAKVYRRLAYASKPRARVLFA